jgi:tRNA (guanine10-N2)-methyltransferase
VLDCLTFDVTRNAWRRGGLFDAIITDPPCESTLKLSIVYQSTPPKLILGDDPYPAVLDGVRAGAKRLGRNEMTGKLQKDEPVLMPDGTYSHLQVFSCQRSTGGINDVADCDRIVMLV